MKEDVEAFAAAIRSPGRCQPRHARAHVRGARRHRPAAARVQADHPALSPARATSRSQALTARRSALKRAGAARERERLIVRASALALVKHPALNAQLVGEEILQYAHADIAIAVATADGLITPIVRGADSLSLAQIARQSAELAERARDGTLTREEITGGTFTVSNLGMYGLDSFDAIINPPQVAILAVGAVRERDRAPRTARGDAPRR